MPKPIRATELAAMPAPTAIANTLSRIRADSLSVARF